MSDNGDYMTRVRAHGVKKITRKSLDLYILPLSVEAAIAVDEAQAQLGDDERGIKLATTMKPHVRECLCDPDGNRLNEEDGDTVLRSIGLQGFQWLLNEVIQHSGMTEGALDDSVGNSQSGPGSSS